MKELRYRAAKKAFALFLIVFALPFGLHAQAPEPPIPIEMLFGNDQLYYQMVVKKKFSPESKLGFFTVATYSASYLDPKKNNVVLPVQFNYSIAKGFGVMAGTEINSAAGFSPIVGPHHSFASRQVLAVTVASLFLNKDKDFKIFGLYEYKPPISKNWSLYSRLQFIYNHNMRENMHNRSYIYLRGGLKKGPLVFGIGANLDQLGPGMVFQDNYGVFVRWEFR
jgi:hypothetical protein